ncbi:MAG: hypothetical protein BWX80_01613 [Candidatus Hydrogenedentes bacterium ADurb.Bin101]|nr:MAG: hypothetical protein BWX80_01613 [Candidatus Hydrogenedentes bacterium ADurb.Bin101]
MQTLLPRTSTSIYREMHAVIATRSPRSQIPFGNARSLEILFPFLHRFGRCIPALDQDCEVEPRVQVRSQVQFGNEHKFNIPTGFKNKAQGCGTPLPWVGNRPQFRFTPKGLRHTGTNAVWENRRNSVGVEKREGEISLTQGSGVPQPWAMIWNPVGILNTHVGISIPYPEGKDVGNE